MVRIALWVAFAVALTPVLAAWVRVALRLMSD